MAYLLRAIKNNIRWDKTQFPSWVPKEDLPSCITLDIQADNNAISLWEIPDDDASQIVIGIASKRKIYQAYFDYALLDKSYIDEITFQCLTVDGETPYSAINTIYHRELSSLSINKLVYFAHLLSRNGRFVRMRWKEVHNLLLGAFINDRLDLKLVPDELKRQLVLDAIKNKIGDFNSFLPESVVQLRSSVKQLLDQNKLKYEEVPAVLKSD
jgi:hypothetical protein